MGTNDGRAQKRLFRMISSLVFRSLAGLLLADEATYTF
jgi:hypothetical protein